jgi:4-nitrophenyl phosphatase
MTILSGIKTILLDMDGVLWRGGEPVVDIQELFCRISKLGMNVFCLTNNSTRTVQSYRQKIISFGADIQDDQIITSAEASSAFLAKKFPTGGPVFVVGEDGLLDALDKRSFKPIADREDNKPLAVVVGLDRGFTYQKLENAAKWVIQGVPLIGTNPDKTIPTPQGTAPGAGAIISAIETASGTQAVIIGKPERHLYIQALERARCQPQEALMVGDRLETDIAGAQQNMIRTGLVLTGITSLNDASTWKPTPDIIANDAVELLNELKSDDTQYL